MQKPVKVFHRRLLWLERLSYLLILLPFATDIIERNGLPRGRRDLVTEFCVGVMIVCFVLILRRTRIWIEKLNGLRSNLAQSIVHDLKNPLTSIMGCLSTLRDHRQDDEANKRLMGLAVAGCRRQMEMLKTLLDIDHMETVELELKKTRVEIRSLLQACFSEVSGIAAAKRVVLKDKTGLLPADVYADRDFLRRILVNLVKNAIEHTPPGGDVAVAALFNRGKNEFCFEVTDTGSGIPKQSLPRIFEKFYQADPRDASRRGGAGLGLYFCKMAVEAHGGRIAVESEPGWGTRVAFVLPGMFTVDTIARSRPRPGAASVEKEG